MTRRTVHDLVADAKAEIEEVSAEETQAEMAAGTAMLIDIRDIRERVEKGVIPGSVSAPRGMLVFWFVPGSPYHQERYQLEGRYIFHCASGWRSALAAKVIQEIGFTNVAHLETGFTGWVDADLPVEDITETSKWIKRP